MIKKIEHIGIAVRDLKGSNEIFKKIFGNSHYKVEKVESEGVSTSFFKIGETKIELLEPLGENSPIAKFLERNSDGGIHHICYEVDDVRAGTPAYMALEQLAGREVSVRSDIYALGLVFAVLMAGGFLIMPIYMHFCASGCSGC